MTRTLGFPRLDGETVRLPKNAPVPAHGRSSARHASTRAVVPRVHESIIMNNDKRTETTETIETIDTVSLEAVTGGCAACGQQGAACQLKQRQQGNCPDGNC
jgi:hypothetical protein